MSTHLLPNIFCCSPQGEKVTVDTICYQLFLPNNSKLEVSGKDQGGHKFNNIDNDRLQIYLFI